jgi:vacuolar protein sorting-associated protein 54
METLTKETMTLHCVLSRHLNEGGVSMIARRIAAEYKAQWNKAFGEVEVKTENGKGALVRDAESFEAKLGKVEEFGGVGREVLGIVRAKVGFVDEVKAEKVEAKPEKEVEKDEKKDEVAPAPAERDKGENGEVEAGEEIKA